MNGRQAHRTGTFLLSFAMLAIGLALIVQSATGGGLISARLLLGVLFVAAGVGRAYLEIRRSQR